jgi:hypothetical protein
MSFEFMEASMDNMRHFYNSELKKKNLETNYHLDNE